MTGSARSVQGFDLYNALQQCADTIEQFGGHKFAAGLTDSRGVNNRHQLFDMVNQDTIKKRLAAGEQLLHKYLAVYIAGFASQIGQCTLHLHRHIAHPRWQKSSQPVSIPLL